MRGFSDDEREAIRDDLVDAGRELLLQYGPEKTTVADVTEAVGIAKGTFYQFFDAKGELYLAVFERERDEFVERVRKELGDEDDAERGLRQLFTLYADWVEESPLMQRLVVEGDRDQLLRDIPADRLNAYREDALAELAPIVERWQTDGDMREVDPVVFYGTMSAIGLVVINREEYEGYRPGFYESVRDLLVESLARGLTTA
jgi:AcrR family transcriptional regulator